MTDPKPERMTDEAFDGLTAFHDGTQGCGDMEDEARRARAEEKRLTGELVASNVLCDALALELGDGVLGRVQAEGERDEALERRDGYRESARRLARLFGQRFEDTLCGYAFDCGTSPFSLRCAHCRLPLGEFCSDDDSMAAARAHVVACSSHPMRAVEAERDSARADSERLIRERDEAQRHMKAHQAALDAMAMDLNSAERERDAARAESAGRLKVLDEKAGEARREWTRAENAEGERDAARKDVDRLTKERDKAQSGAFEWRDLHGSAQKEAERLRRRIKKVRSIVRNAARGNRAKAMETAFATLAKEVDNAR